MTMVDIGVVPKRRDLFGNEAFSTKIMEFMIIGVPVIVSRTRIDEYYFTDDVVQFFEPGNAEDLAARIFELAHDEARRSAIEKYATRFIRQNAWDVKKQAYLEIVDALVQRRHASPSTALRGATIT